MLDPRYPDVAFLYAEEDFEVLASKFLEKLKKDYENDHITREEYNAYIRKFASECSFMDEELDEYRRITLDEHIIKTLELNDKVFIYQDSNKLVLCKDKEAYEEYKKAKSK